MRKTANKAIAVSFKKAIDKYPEKDIKMPLITDGNTCFDFYAPEKTVIYPGNRSVKVGTGLMFEIPKGYHMEIYMRSSYGSKRGLRMSDCVGIIDNSYRGEVIGAFDNIGTLPEIIEKGERFMPGKIAPDVTVEFTEKDSLSQTQRGEGGFGSTGK